MIIFNMAPTGNQCWQGAYAWLTVIAKRLRMMHSALGTSPQRALSAVRSPIRCWTRPGTEQVCHCLNVLFALAFVHSAWLIIRFRVVGNMTAYERATGAKHNGRVCPFGELVYAQIEPKQKGPEGQPRS